jgi:hypothetical protein
MIYIKQLEIFSDDSQFNSDHYLAERHSSKIEEYIEKANESRVRNNLVGQRFGMLTVIKLTEKRLNASPVYLCQCDCGHTIEASPQYLMRSNSPTSHCGCQGVGKKKRPAPGKGGIHWKNVNKQKPNKQTAFKALLATYRNNAANRGYQWNLTEFEFISLINDNCYYCGAKPNQVFRRDPHEIIYNGIDRVDSSGDYSIENVVTACGDCNIAKKERPVKEFLEWVDRIYTHQHNK